jgi:hypothetical protein
MILGHLRVIWNYFSTKKYSVLNKLVYNPTRCYAISKYLFTWIHMPISYLWSERRSASSSLWMSLCGGMMGVRQRWEGTTVVGRAPMMWCFGYWGGKMETWLSGGESDQGWDGLFYRSGGFESDGLGRVACGGGADSLPKDEVEAESSSWLNGNKARYGAVAWRRQPEERQHRGGKREETTLVGLMRILLGQKM